MKKQKLELIKKKNIINVIQMLNATTAEMNKLGDAIKQCEKENKSVVFYAGKKEIKISQINL